MNVHQLICKRISSKILVSLQFLLIVILLFINESVLTSIFSFFISFFGFILGISTLIYNKISNFNIRPEIKDEAQLITIGTYKFIRHPMYSAVLLIMLGVISTDINFINSLIYLFLTLVLFLKARREENLWSQRFSKYIDYMKQTKMFVPFIF